MTLLLFIMCTVYLIRFPQSAYWEKIILGLMMYSSQGLLQWKISNKYNPCKRNDHVLVHCCRENFQAEYQSLIVNNTALTALQCTLFS